MGKCLEYRPNSNAAAEGQQPAAAMQWVQIIEAARQNDTLMLVDPFCLPSSSLVMLADEMAGAGISPAITADILSIVSNLCRVIGNNTDKPSLIKARLLVEEQCLKMQDNIIWALVLAGVLMWFDGKEWESEKARGYAETEILYIWLCGKMLEQFNNLSAAADSKLARQAAEVAKATKAIHGHNPASTNIMQRCDVLPIVQKAKAKGLFSEINGFYEWKRSKVLLSYFLGRLFCKDRYNKQYDIWESGGSAQVFPTKEIGNKWYIDGTLYASKLLEHQRHTRQNTTPPRGHTEIDDLFC